MSPQLITTSGSTLVYTEGQPADCHRRQPYRESTRTVRCWIMPWCGSLPTMQRARTCSAFTNQLGITGVWNAATGTLLLTGSASAANYQTALRSVTYQDLSEDPSGGSLVVSFVVNDGIADGAIATRAINVIGRERCSRADCPGCPDNR